MASGLAGEIAKIPSHIHHVAHFLMWLASPEADLAAALFLQLCNVLLRHQAEEGQVKGQLGGGHQPSH